MQGSTGRSDIETNPEAPPGDPLEIFSSWYEEAVRSGAPFPDAVALATAGRSGQPAVRFVLFKGIADGTLRFVTNFESRKGRELDENPRAAIAFFWPALGRQVRMEGTMSRAPEGDSDAYFASRDRDTQLGAWASAQSRPIASRAALESEFERQRELYAGRDVPRPPHWGMLTFVPVLLELWQSGQHRLHDRFRYERSGSGWNVTRLAP